MFPELLPLVEGTLHMAEESNVLATHTVSLNTVLNWIQLGFMGIMVPVGFALVNRLSQIRDHLARLNGHVQEINQWRADHDKLVEQESHHHDAQHQQCAALHAERMNNVHAQLQQLWGRIGDRRRPNLPTD